MKLIIDIGNTVTKMVAFRGDEPVDELRVESGALSGLADFVGKHGFRSGIVGSVRDLTYSEEEALANLPFPLLKLSHDTPIPIANRYRTPETLGSDRLAAVVGASSLKPGKDLLIIDAGTCITYEVIDARGNYWGGNIAPGMQMRRPCTSSPPACLSSKLKAMCPAWATTRRQPYAAACCAA